MNQKKNTKLKKNNYKKNGIKNENQNNIQHLSQKLPISSTKKSVVKIGIGSTWHSEVRSSYLDRMFILVVLISPNSPSQKGSVELLREKFFKFLQI